jgi:acetyl esterase
MAWFAAQYTAGVSDVSNPMVSPILADATGLPPAVIVSAGHDPLLDEVRSYCSHLAAAGVPVTHLHFGPLTHGFVGMAARSPAASAAMREAFAALRRVLARQPE